MKPETIALALAITGRALIERAAVIIMLARHWDLRLWRKSSICLGCPATRSSGGRKH